MAHAPTKHHPVVLRLDAERAEDLQLRVADRITAFAGSMPFLYLHVVAFGVWMVFLEKSPWPTLTLAVSLEAIFLSTFVMIGQNRAAAFQQAKADHDFQEEEQELHVNTDLTREIHALTREVLARIVSDGSEPPGGQIDVASGRSDVGPSGPAAHIASKEGMS